MMNNYLCCFFLGCLFFAVNVGASLNSEFVFSQKLGTHIETVISKTKRLRHSVKTPEGLSFVFGGYLNGAPKIFSRTLYIFKDDRLIFINLYADNPARKFGGPEERNKWSYDFFRALTKNLRENYGSYFSKNPPRNPTYEDYIFYENCNDSYYLEGNKKGIGIYINKSREVGLSYFDVNAVEKLNYGRFLKEARRSLIAFEFAEAQGAEKTVSARKPASMVDPNIAMKIKLD